MNNHQNKMSFYILLKVYFRSLFIQSSWNFEKMQNLGFIYSIMPALRKIYSDNIEDLKSAVDRHCAFFNTHPYFTAPILGATIKLEEECKAQISNAEKINTFKNSLMGICGGAGDAFFWSVLRPFASVVGVILALTYHSFYAPLGCFIVYNTFHFSFRTFTFFSGYKKGIAMTETLKKIDLTTRTDNLKVFHAIVLGLLLAIIKNKFMIYNFNTLFYNLISYCALLSSIFLLYFLIKKRINPIIMIYIFSTLLVLLIYFI